MHVEWSVMCSIYAIEKAVEFDVVPHLTSALLSGCEKERRQKTTI